jgi:hypothetical protein
MGLDKIQLPQDALQDLYKNTLLVLENKQEKASPEKTPAALRSLGQNQQKIAILVDYEQVTFLPDDDLAFITQVLGACKLSLADVAIVNRNNGPVSFALLANQLSPQKVLLFGLSAADIDLPVVFPHFQVQAYGGCTFLSAPVLTDIKDDKALKASLWGCLKQLFDV